MSGSGIDGYRDYLARRDGDADLLNRRLASREEFFKSLEAEPIRSIHPIDRRVFARNLHRRRPEPGVDRQMLFLLATAKLNQAERFGVGLGETYGHNSGDDVPPERVYMELEEHYHTRLLAYVLDMFGLPFQVAAPPFVMRQFVKIAVFLPERRRARCCSANRAALQRDPHRRNRPRRLLRSALYPAGTRDDASALPACRPAVSSTDCRDQPSHQSQRTSLPSRPALRRRGALCRSGERDIPRCTPLTGLVRALNARRAPTDRAALRCRRRHGGSRRR
jgi:hypothetical protein